MLDDIPAAANAFLKGLNCCNVESEFVEERQWWATAMAGAFHYLNRQQCDQHKKPSWWSDTQLLAISQRVVDEHPSAENSWTMRAAVLCPSRGSASVYTGWNRGARSATQFL